MKIITKQGKEFELSDIVLYSVVKNKIITMVNDEEQMKKFCDTGRLQDAPISIIDYSLDAFNEIIMSMKQIKSYKVSDSDEIEVEYKDGTNIKFNRTNMSIIKENFESQKNANIKKAFGIWYDMPNNDKDAKKRTTKKKVLRGISASLAALVVAGGLYFIGKNIKESKNIKGEIISEEMYNHFDTRKNELVLFPKSEFTDEAKDFYEEINSKNIEFINNLGTLKFDQEKALEIIEFINGNYPTSMLAMNENNSNKEATELMELINVIIGWNLTPETKENEMIDLSKYIVNEKERVFVHNAMVMSRACIDESIGEPMRGEILDESKWASPKKFTRKCKNSFEKLVHYEYETLDDSDFVTSSAGAKYVITSTFKIMDKVIPHWIHVYREKSEYDVREFELYYIYFFDNVEKITYLPERGKNNETLYRGYWADEYSLCHEEGPYTEEEMFIMAGFPIDGDKEKYNVTRNDNIRDLGVQTQVDAKHRLAMEEFLSLKKAATKSK